MSMALLIIGYVLQGLQLLAPMLGDLLAHLGPNHPAAQHISTAIDSIAQAQAAVSNAKDAVKP